MLPVEHVQLALLAKVKNNNILYLIGSLAVLPIIIAIIILNYVHRKGFQSCMVGGFQGGRSCLYS